LSTDVIALFKHADLKKGSIYVQHCPMANNGDGGDWLATENKIQNPYYGDEMMECGRVLEEIKPAM
jgi:Cu(I)/Ag(I) efflux system membrane fusion protein